MVHARHSGVLRVAEDGRAQLWRPAQSLEFANADKRVFFQRWMPFVIEVMQERGGCVELEHPFAIRPTQAKSIGLSFAARRDANLDSTGMFAQVVALGPLL